MAVGEISDKEARMMIFPIPIIMPMLGFGGGRQSDPFRAYPWELVFFGLLALAFGGAALMLGIMVFDAAGWLPLVPPSGDWRSGNHQQLFDTLDLVMKWYARFAILAGAGVIVSAAVWKVRRIIRARA